MGGIETTVSSPFFFLHLGGGEREGEATPITLTASIPGDEGRPPSGIPGSLKWACCKGTAPVVSIDLNCCWLIGPKLRKSFQSPLTDTDHPQSPLIQMLAIKIGWETCPICSAVHGTRRPVQATVNWLSCLHVHLGVPSTAQASAPEEAQF